MSDPVRYRSSKDHGTLKKLALINRSESKKNYYTNFSDPEDLLKELPQFSKHLKLKNSYTRPVWTSLFYEALTNNTCLSSSLPVFFENQQIGIVSLKVTFLNMFAESFYFHPNKYSYSFVINNYGYVLHHLYLDSGENLGDKKIKITSIEREQEFIPIYKSLLSGGYGMKTYKSKRYLKVGGENNAYQSPILVNSFFFWQQIDGSPFSICFVLFRRGRRLKLKHVNVSVPHFLHHRLDLSKPIQFCNHFNVPSTTSQTSVFLSLRCYQDADFLKYYSFTKYDIEKIYKFMAGTGPNVFSISEGAKFDIFLTTNLDKFWNISSLHDHSSHSILWRYLVATSGVVRVFPAIDFPKTFDPQLTTEYIQTTSSPNKIIVSLPKTDWATNLKIIRISKALTLKRNNYTTVFGMMGFDMLLDNFIELFQKTYSNFFSPRYRLYIFDDSAELVIYKSFYESNIYFSKLTNFLQAEPEIAYALTQVKIFQKVYCSNIKDHLATQRYTVSSTIQEFVSQVSIGGTCYEYTFSSISGTNLFIVIRELSESTCTIFYPEASCFCNKEINKFCTFFGTDRCECPCSYPHSFYKQCTNEYDWEKYENSLPDHQRISSICSEDYKQDFVFVHAESSNLPKCFRVFQEKEEELSVFPIIVVILTGIFVSLLLALQRNAKKKRMEQKKLISEFTEKFHHKDFYPDGSYEFKRMNLKALLEPLTFGAFDEFQTKFFTTSSTQSSYNFDIYRSHHSIVETRSDTTIEYSKASNRVHATSSLHDLKPCHSF